MEELEQQRLELEQERSRVKQKESEIRALGFAKLKGPMPGIHARPNHYAKIETLFSTRSSKGVLRSPAPLFGSKKSLRSRYRMFTV